MLEIHPDSSSKQEAIIVVKYARFHVLAYLYYHPCFSTLQSHFKYEKLADAASQEGLKLHEVSYNWYTRIKRQMIKNSSFFCLSIKRRASLLMIYSG